MLERCYIPNVLEAGCDEAGRGPLAGPVFAAAVILPADFSSEMLNDSKQLTERQRYELRPLIEEKAVAWAIGQVSATEIDQINILNASILAMHRALRQLKPQPEHILVDGNRFKPYCPDENGLLSIPYRTIVKGDGKYMSIAAASILAKTYRDDFMIELSREYPMYGWEENKGYPTRQHQQALKQYGASIWHRKSFRLKY